MRGNATQYIWSANNRRFRFNVRGSLVHSASGDAVELYLLMDLPIGTVSRFPSEVPLSWTYRWSSENGCNPSIETARIVASADFDLILNRSVVRLAIPEHRC